MGRAHGTEELVDDRVEPPDFAPRHAQRFEQVIVIRVAALAQIALHELEMNVERVERIAELVRDARGQQRHGIELLRLDRLARLVAPRGQVVENDGEAHERRVLVLQRDEIEIEIARLRVKHLEVAIDHAALGQDGGPVKFLQVLRNRRAHGLGRVDAEQRGDGVVEVEDAAVRIDHDDAFLERIEDRLKKALFVVEPLQVSLQVARSYPVDPVKELIQERVFHREREILEPALASKPDD